VVKGINSTVRLYSALMCANEDGGNETVKGLLGKYGWKLERVTATDVRAAVGQGKVQGKRSRHNQMTGREGTHVIDGKSKTMGPEA